MRIYMAGNFDLNREILYSKIIRNRLFSYLFLTEGVTGMSCARIYFINKRKENENISGKHSSRK